MNTNIDKRQIRIFISSTFQDMQEERDYLITKVFPRLQVEAARRDVSVIPLDLRWGITEEESKSGKVIEICLREIENTRPFFIGLLGNRYGWCPTQKELERNTNLSDRWGDWLREDIRNGLSVTEIEMQYGVLRANYHLNAFFYIRKSSADDKSERDKSNLEKLTKLKKTVRNNNRYPVFDYDSVETLGSQVEIDFMRLLDSLYPAHSMTELDKERINQESFIRSRTEIFVPNETDFEKINSFVNNSQSQFLILSGESGTGKSALLSNWISRHNDNDNYKIISHFVGQGCFEGNHHKIIDRLIEEIRHLYGVQLSVVSNKWDNYELLNNILSNVALQIPLVVVLDGVNQLSDTSNAKLMNWLPIPPSNVKYIISTIPSDKTMSNLQRLHPDIMGMNTMGKRQRKEFVIKYLGKYHKSLTDTQICRIIDDQKNGIPLVLKTLLDELITFGKHDKLNEQIDSYLNPHTIEAFFQRVLQQYEYVFGQHFVSQVLGLIAVSQHGLKEEEILNISRIKKQLDWSRFYCAFHNHFIIINGYIIFSHPYIQDAVLTRYSDKLKELRYNIINYMSVKTTSRAYDELPYQYYELDDHYHLFNYISNFIVFDYIHSKDEYELAKYWIQLKNISNDYSFEVYLNKDHALEENVQYAYYLNAVGFFIGNHFQDFELALKFHEKALAIREIVEGSSYPEIASSYNNIGTIYQRQGKYEDALKYYMHSLELRKKYLGEHNVDTATSYNNIASIYNALGRYEEAVEYCLKCYKIQLENWGNDYPLIASTLNNLGAYYGQASNYSKEFEYKLMAIEVGEKTLGINHPELATMYNNLGVYYEKRNKYAEALLYFHKALSIDEKTYNRFTHPKIATDYNNLGSVYCSMGKYDLSMDYYKKANDIFIYVYGMNHESTATAYNNIGGVLDEMENYEKALEYRKKALEIRIKVFGSEHPIVASTYNCIGSVYYHSGEPSEALQYFEKALLIQKKTIGKQDLEISISYNNIGHVYHNKGNYEKALEYYLTALNIMQRNSEPCIDMVLLCEDIGLIYQSTERYQNAIYYYKYEITICDTLFGNDCVEKAKALNYLGTIYSEMKDFEKSDKYYTQAYVLCKHHLGLDHYFTQLVNSNLEHLKQESN